MRTAPSLFLFASLALSATACAVDDADATTATDDLAIKQFYMWSFQPQDWSNGMCAGTNDQCDVGRIDGDKAADLIDFVKGPDGTAVVALSSTTQFVGTATVGGVCFASEDCHLADVTGDGHADIVAFHHNDDQSGTSDVYVAVAANTQQYGGFYPRQKVLRAICSAWSYDPCRLADVDGDRMADIVTGAFGGFGQYIGVYRSNCGSFGAWESWAFVSDWGAEFALADVNGDGLADVVETVNSDPPVGPFGNVRVLLSQGDHFDSPVGWASGNSYYADVYGDVNGDGRADRLRLVGGAQVELSDGARFRSASNWGDAVKAYPDDTVIIADVNGDGFNDVVTVKDTGRILVGLTTRSLWFPH
jgi:FG-GAP-like repeat